MSKTFLLKPEHLKLIRHMYVGWDDTEFGAPAIDPKRPYGNSNVLEDIAEILGWDLDTDGWGNTVLTAEQAVYARQLHKETQTALQVILQKHTVSWGTYVNTRDYDNRWERDYSVRNKV